MSAFMPGSGMGVNREMESYPVDKYTSVSDFEKATDSKINLADNISKLISMGGKLDITVKKPQGNLKMVFFKLNDGTYEDTIAMFTMTGIKIEPIVQAPDFSSNQVQISTGMQESINVGINAGKLKNFSKYAGS